MLMILFRIIWRLNVYRWFNTPSHCSLLRSWHWLWMKDWHWLFPSAQASRPFYSWNADTWKGSHNNGVNKECMLDKKSLVWLQSSSSQVQKAHSQVHGPSHIAVYGILISVALDAYLYMHMCKEACIYLFIWANCQPWRAACWLLTWSQNSWCCVFHLSQYGSYSQYKR